MKKTLCMILALLIIASSLPAIITSYADDSVNLLADARNSNGAVTWDSDIDVREDSIDSLANSVSGSPSWTFGLGNADHTTEDYERVYIKASGLTVGTNYDFSFIYQKDYIFAIESIKTANGDNADFTVPTTTTVAEKERSYQVSTALTVPVNGDYTITLITGRCTSMRAPGCDWNVVVLGDLSLTKTAEALNYLKNATHSNNGGVTWTTSTDVAQKVGNIDARAEFKDGYENPAFSVNNSCAWVFGLGEAAVAGDVYAYVYIKAQGLTANTKYDFSYIYQKDYIIAFDKITDKDGAVVELETASRDVKIGGGNYDNTNQVFATFVAPADGDYTITLKTNRDMRPTKSDWSFVVLSDLVLIKSTAAAKVDAEVLVSGNGDATVSEDLPAIGSQVTYTATPWPDEEFLGWYKGDEKISDSLVYSFAVTEKVTLTAKFTSNSLNVLAGKKATDWTGWHWLRVSDSTESKNGGKGYLLNSVMWQSMYTTVTLKANTEYDFSFNWKGIANEKGVAYPSEIMVYPVNAVDINDRANNWSDNGDGGMFAPKTGTDLETGGGYATEAMAKTYQWQSVNTAFTTTSETDYHVIVYFTINGSPGEQAINVSDFVLKEKSAPVVPPVTPDEDVELSEKDAAHWTGYEHAKIENSTESKDGGKGYLVNDAMYQSVYTKLNLKANTEYKLSFNWKAVQNDVCPAYPAAIKVYSASAADIEDRTNNWSNGGNFTPKTGTDLETGSGYANEDIAKTYEWQNISTGFTTTADTEYNLVIQFAISGNPNHQAINLSDFVLEEVVKENPALSEKDATDWTGYEWATIENSDVSRYGGKAYLVRKAMHQNIYTSLTLKPNTKYSLSFEWKSVQNEKGPVYPNDIFVTAKNDIDIEDRANNWTDSNFKGAIYDLELGGTIDNSAAALTYDWQNTTVSFNTKADTEYNFLIHFRIDGGNGEQEIYVSDFKLEELGSVEDDDENADPDNLAAKYTAVNGNVTWTDNADPHADKIDRRSDIEGGYSWGFGFGFADNDYEKNPAYITIKTHELEANHKYEFSFSYQKDFIIALDSIDSDIEIIKEVEDVKLLEGDRAHRVTVRFATTKAGVHNIKLITGKHMTNENCQWSHTVLCDLKLYDITNRVYGSVKSELGGTVTGFDTAYCTKGDNIVLTATPRSGNTFKGWYDEAGKLVSANAVFEFTAESDFNYLAVFEGTNLPNSEWLGQHGMDGTFENGLMDGWKAEDRESGDDTSWALFDRSDDMAYNGDYSLKIRARYRTSFFRFNDLKKGTNYLLSFYVTHPDLFVPKTSDEQEPSEYNEEAVIRWFSITSGAGGAELYSDSGSNIAPAIKGGSGWYKVNIYFNTADFTSVDWNFYYTNKNGAEKEYIYMDDVSLTEYTSNTFTNGNFESGAAPWRGEFSVASGAANVTEGNSVYQNAELGTQSLYTVSFKAKGKGVAGAAQMTTNPFDVTNNITSESTVNIDSTDWKNYSYTVFSGINPAAAIYFKSNSGTLSVDDVTVTKIQDRSGAIVEKIDFESDRFALHTASDVFEIYNGSAGDANVHSGTKSLRFNSAKAQNGISYVFEDAFVSAQVVPKINYRLTLYYKTAKGNSLYLAPEFLPDEETVETVYTAENNGWTKVDFMFNKMTISYAKVIIGNILGKTNGDFYIDDITLTVAPPMVLETNSIKKYCEWPLNVLNNEGFEKNVTATDWVNLPKTAAIRNDNGANGKKYLRVNGGTHYVLPVQLEASENYYLSVSSRLGANSSGFVAITSDSKGTALYNDMNGTPSSKITVDSASWNRDSFKFSTSETGKIYLVFSATSGYIDLDDVHIYKQQYGWETDPNDHTEFIPYNYDNPDPSTIVYNGGDPTFGGVIDPEEIY